MGHRHTEPTLGTAEGQAWAHFHPDVVLSQFILQSSPLRTINPSLTEGSQMPSKSLQVTIGQVVGSSKELITLKLGSR